MPAPTYVKHQRVSLKDHPQLDERWLQDRIAEDPSILGLGDLLLRDRERPQPRAGRLDLLLQDPEENRRYEVEIQLGKSDESHIIRTLEYWDIEKKRYPQYEHTAVLVAEDITSRFLNIISLFNGFIPLVAVQLNAVRVGESISLIFTTVLDQLTLGLVDEDEVEVEATDRAYWEHRANPSILAMADDCLEIIRSFAPEFEQSYKKFYIGLARNGRTNNFVIVRPQKNGLRVEFRLSRSEELGQELEDAGLDLMDYSRWGRYRIRLTPGDLKKHRELLARCLKLSFEEYGAQS
jgi:hypothetical protein